MKKICILFLIPMIFFNFTVYSFSKKNKSTPIAKISSKQKNKKGQKNSNVVKSVSEKIKETKESEQKQTFIQKIVNALSWKRNRKGNKEETKIKNESLSDGTKKIKASEKKIVAKKIKELESGSKQLKKEGDEKIREEVKTNIRKSYGPSTLEEIDNQIKLRQQSLKTLKNNKKTNKDRIKRMEFSIESLKTLKKDASESNNSESYKLKIRDEKREIENEKLEEEKKKLKEKTILENLDGRKFRATTQKWVDSLSPDEAVKKYKKFGVSAKIYEGDDFLYARASGKISSWGADETRFEVKALRKKIDEQKKLRKNNIEDIDEQIKDIQDVIDIEKDSLNKMQENLRTINEEIEKLKTKEGQSSEEKEKDLIDLKDWLTSKQFMEEEIKKYQANIDKEENSLKEQEEQKRIFNLEPEEFKKELDESRDKSIVLEREVSQIQKNLKKINESKNPTAYKKEEEKLSEMKKELEVNEAKRKLYEKRAESDI